MSHSDDDFDSVSQGGVLWEPKQKGSQKTNDLMQLQPTDKSFVVGYYIGMREIQTKGNGTSIMHSLTFDSCGDMSHLKEPVEQGSTVDFWGTQALNDSLATIEKGSFIRVKWLGKKESKSSGRPYSIWDVGVSNKIPPLSVSGGSSVSNQGNSSETSNQAQGGATETSSGFDDGNNDEDDLPF